MFEFLRTIRVPLALALIAALTLVLSRYEISGEIWTPTVARLQEPDATFFWLGLVFAALSLGLYLTNEKPLISLKNKGTSAIRDGENGFEFDYASGGQKLTISVDFGELQDFLESKNPNGVVVLPVNDSFEDKCFEDTRSALGSVIASEFGFEGARNLLSQRDNALAGIPDNAGRYPVGTPVLFELEGKRLLVIVVSIKTEAGVSTDIHYLHIALENVLKTVLQREYDTVCFPLIGAGKGGLPAKVALAELQNAIFEAYRKPSGRVLQKARIVIHRSDDTPPAISPDEAKEISRSMVALWST